MLQIYTLEGDRLNAVDAAAPVDAAAVPLERMAAWIDLINPVPAEVSRVQAMLAVEIPSREDMQEIEYSSRLYSEDGAEFLTVAAVTQLDADEPVMTPISFILKGSTLVTVRYAEPKPFIGFTLRAQKPHAVPCSTGQLVMYGLLEAMIDRMADALERVGTEIDHISRGVFRAPPSRAAVKSRNLQQVIEQIGRKGDLITMVRESLVTFYRLLTYHAAIDETGKQQRKEGRARIKLLQRDIASLNDHATFLSSKINFLLDATLGLINLEQNQIIKIFSIAAVVFLPPTLVASIYGMNFDHMPELKWLLGYPWALGLMLISAILPFAYFKKRGWL
jgi:magnesium transporter